MRLFEWPWFLPVAALTVVAAVGMVVVGWRRRRSRLLRFGAPDLLPRLVPAQAWAPPSARGVRLALAVLLAGLALAGPRWGEEPTLVRGDGVDIVLALDASLSMLATDERPSRLERMKQEVRRLRARATPDRVALLAFAGRSYILTPLTVDDGALELFLDNLDPSVVGQAGSSLSRTISQGVELLQATQTGADRALVVMSDGEAFESTKDVTDAAARAGEAGIAVITVGFGTTQGSTIPIVEGDRVTQKRDEQGAVVITKYHPEVLQEVATAARGTFIDAAETDKASRVIRALQGLRGSGRALAGGVQTTRRFQLFLLPAILLLLLDSWWSTGRRRRAIRTPASAALVMLVLVQGCAWRNDSVGQGATAYRAGSTARAVALYRFAVSRGDRRPAVLYNLGTALLSADSLDVALEPLERAMLSDDGELAFRALFNGGLVHLVRGLAGAVGSDSVRESLRGAREAYKRALHMRSSDRDAKWNYELALERDRQGGGGGGGGGGASKPNRAPEPDESQNDRPSGNLGNQQAEQLLNSAAREERGVQGRKQRQSRQRPPPGGKDW